MDKVRDGQKKASILKKNMVNLGNFRLGSLIRVLRNITEPVFLEAISRHSWKR